MKLTIFAVTGRLQALARVGHGANANLRPCTAAGGAKQVPASWARPPAAAKQPDPTTHSGGLFSRHAAS
jgi:hypothetical protein